MEALAELESSGICFLLLHWVKRFPARKTLPGTTACPMVQREYTHCQVDFSGSSKWEDLSPISPRLPSSRRKPVIATSASRPFKL